MRRGMIVPKVCANLSSEEAPDFKLDRTLCKLKKNRCHARPARHTPPEPVRDGAALDHSAGWQTGRSDISSGHARGAA